MIEKERFLRKIGPALVGLGSMALVLSGCGQREARAQTSELAYNSHIFAPVLTAGREVSVLEMSCTTEPKRVLPWVEVPAGVAYFQAPHLNPSHRPGEEGWRVFPVVTDLQTGRKYIGEPIDGHNFEIVGFVYDFAVVSDNNTLVIRKGQPYDFSLSLAPNFGGVENGRTLYRQQLTSRSCRELPDDFNPFPPLPLLRP